MSRVEDDLAAFAALLRKWNAAQNLVSRETVGALWPRHIADSLQVLPLLRPQDSVILDLGSGGGFPALPLAIASRGTGRHFVLVEPNARKAAFLRAASRDLQLDAEVRAVRAEALDSRETFPCITSRALAALPALLALATPLLAPKGHMVLHKGRNYRQELDAAAQHFAFDVLVHPSETDAEGVLLELSAVQAKSAL